MYRLEAFIFLIYLFWQIESKKKKKKAFAKIVIYIASHYASQSFPVPYSV